MAKETFLTGDYNPNRFNVGVSNSKLDIHLPTIILLCVAVTLYAYLISMWAARRIKKISAYSLIVE